VVKDKKRVEFQIEPGTENGERIALKGEGDEAVRSSPPTPISPIPSKWDGPRHILICRSQIFQPAT
jgi:DnaJ family protein A protein 2